jgi:hypothetical protein
MKLVGSAKDLKPDSLIELRRTADPYLNTKVLFFGDEAWHLNAGSV